MKKMQKIGTVATAVLMMGCMSLPAFAAETPSTTAVGNATAAVALAASDTVAATEVQSYVDYVKGLNVLNEQELKQVAEVEAKTKVVEDKYASLFASDTWTEREDAQYEAMLDELRQVYESIPEINQKIAAAEEAQFGSLLQEAVPATEGGDEVAMGSFLDYVKEMNVLNEQELAAYTDVYNQVDALFEKNDALLQKEDWTADEEAQYEAMSKEINKLYESIAPIMDKIYEGEMKQGESMDATMTVEATAVK